MQLDEASESPLYQQIYEKIRRDIEEGRYPCGSKLPSIRGLAAELQCSRNTIDAAYSQLVQEGYIESKPGSGYRVLDVAGEEIGFSLREQDQACSLLGEPHLPRYNFTYGNLETGTFPATVWRSITDDILLSVESGACDTYTDPFGEESLRAEIAWRLSTQCDVDCTPGQIIIQPGTQVSIQNLLALFDARNDVVAMENPGYVGARETFERSGFCVAPCRINESYDEFFADLERSQAKLVYVTPSSQFPTCKTMPIKMRSKLIAWADANDAYILEDDYCRDFRYKERPQPPLQSMDHCDRVIYMGTFSKSLSPALRMNYLLLPPALLERWRMLFANAYTSVPWLSQAVLSRFMSQGHWDRQLRRVQAKNKRKYETLTRSLHEYLGDKVRVLENGTGLHLLVEVYDERTSQELIDVARAADVLVYDTEKYWMGKRPLTSRMLLIGFSSIAEQDIEPGIKALANAWLSADL
ncbi:PLP-dependent aminotransferase family protein [Eggerthellaceae bacterium 3-80]|nr:PLP-dependent aminotransferase family protein [bacterium D16-34]